MNHIYFSLWKVIYFKISFMRLFFYLLINSVICLKYYQFYNIYTKLMNSINSMYKEYINDQFTFKLSKFIEIAIQNVYYFKTNNIRISTMYKLCKLLLVNETELIYIILNLNALDYNYYSIEDLHVIVSILTKSQLNTNSNSISIIVENVYAYFPKLKINLLMFLNSSSFDMSCNITVESFNTTYNYFLDKMNYEKYIEIKQEKDYNKIVECISEEYTKDDKRINHSLNISENPSKIITSKRKNRSKLTIGLDS